MKSMYLYLVLAAVAVGASFWLLNRKKRAAAQPNATVPNTPGQSLITSPSTPDPVTVDAPAPQVAPAPSAPPVVQSTPTATVAYAPPSTSLAVDALVAPPPSSPVVGSMVGYQDVRTGRNSSSFSGSNLSGAPVAGTVGITLGDLINNRFSTF